MAISTNPRSLSNTRHAILERKWSRGSLVNIVHGIHEQPKLGLSIQADAINGVMPIPIISVLLVNVASPSLETMVSITYEEHFATKKAEVRV